jgi:hypothetical protein
MSMPLKAKLRFSLVSNAGRASRMAAFSDLVIGGMTGRDVKAVEAHIQELRHIGVVPPKTIPIFYRLSAALLTQADTIQVPGGNSSGEVETVLFGMADGLWVGVGSDHTDRKLESVSVTASKQLCGHPVSKALWPFDEVKDHWDRLILRCFAIKSGKRRLYQHGPASLMRRPEDLMRRYLGRDGILPPGMVMYGGTFSVIGPIAAADAYILELEDPVLRRKIRHKYAVQELPDEG